MTTDSLQKEERILPFLRLFRIGQKVECSQMERNPQFSHVSFYFVTLLGTVKKSESYITLIINMIDENCRFYTI